MQNKHKSADSVLNEIIIRKSKVSDLSGIAKLTKEGVDSGKWLYTGSNKFKKEKIEKLKKSIISKKPELYHFIAIDKKNKKIVGMCHCSFKKSGRTRHRVDCGWSIHPDYFGQGIGTKMLSYMLDYLKKKGFKRAEAEMAIVNKASWKLALKCGFKIEGTKKKALLTDDGKYIDTYIVGKML